MALDNARYNPREPETGPAGWAKGPSGELGEVPRLEQTLDQFDTLLRILGEHVKRVSYAADGLCGHLPECASSATAQSLPETLCGRLQSRLQYLDQLTRQIERDADRLTSL